MKRIALLACITIRLFGAEPERNDLLGSLPPEIRQQLLETSNSLKEAIDSYKKLMSSSKKYSQLLSSEEFFETSVKTLSERFKLQEHKVLIALAFNNRLGTEYFRKNTVNYDLNKTNELVKKALTWSHIYHEQETILKPLFTYLYNDHYFEHFNKTIKRLPTGRVMTSDFKHAPLIRIKNDYYRINRKGKLSQEEYVGTAPVNEDEIPTANFLEIGKWQSEVPCKSYALSGNLYRIQETIDKKELLLVAFWLEYQCNKKPTIVWGIFDPKTRTLSEHRLTLTL